MSTFYVLWFGNVVQRWWFFQTSCTAVHWFELSVMVTAVATSGFVLSFNQVGLCPVFLHPWNTYGPGFVRLLFVQHLSPRAPNSFGEIFLRFVIMYLYLLAQIDWGEPWNTTSISNKSSVFFDAKKGRHFSGEILGHTDAGKGDSNRAGDGGKIDFPFLASAVPHPSLQVLIRQGAPTSSTDLSHKVHHSYFLCIQSSFQALSLPKPPHPIPQAILLTTINSQIFRVLIHHVSESQILSHPCLALCNS